MDNELSDNYRVLADHLMSLGMETNLTAHFFEETLRANTRNLDVTRSIDTELSALQSNSTLISSSAIEADNELSAAQNSSRASFVSLEAGAAAVKQMDASFSGFLAIFQNLSESVRGINKTLSAINEISELTNLLSLNAAIEAARAGAQGRGFKVVADEVKALAEKSRNLTGKASKLLTETEKDLAGASLGLATLQRSKEELVDRMSASHAEQERSTISISGASANMKEINNSLKKQNSNVEQIASSMSALARAINGLTESSNLIQGNLSRQKDSTDKTLQAANTLKKTIDSGIQNLEGTLTVGHDVTYPPWVYIKDGHSAGISVEVTKNIASLAGLSPEFKPAQFSEALDDLLAGKILVLANVGWPNAFFRGKPVLASIPYVHFKPAIFAFSGRSGEFRNTADLKGKRIAAQKGSYVVDCLKEYDCEIVVTANDLESFAAVIWQRADCAITERLVGAFLSRHYFGDTLKLAFETGHKMDVVYLLRKGEEELVRQLDSRIRESASSGTIDAIIARNS